MRERAVAPAHPTRRLRAPPHPYDTATWPDRMPRYHFAYR
jgi:hypothetical protein